MAIEGSLKPEGRSSTVVAAALAGIFWIGVVATGLIAVLAPGQRGMLVVTVVFALIAGFFTYGVVGLRRLELHWDAQRIWDTGTRKSDSMMRSDLAAIYRGRNMAYRGQPVWGFVSRDGKVAMQEPSDFTEDQIKELARVFEIPIKGTWGLTLDAQLADHFRHGLPT